jgi:hypothetical protein
MDYYVLSMPYCVSPTPFDDKLLKVGSSFELTKHKLGDQTVLRYKPNSKQYVVRDIPSEHIPYTKGLSSEDIDKLPDAVTAKVVALDCYQTEPCARNGYQNMMADVVFVLDPIE